MAQIKIEAREYEWDSSYSYDVESTAKGACESLETDYSGDTYICDAITDAADSATPIYRGELFKAADDIEEYIGQAVSEGLIDLSNPRDFSLLRLFQIGYYEFLTAMLYQNLDNIMFNRLAEAANKWGFDDERFDEDELIEAIKAIVKDTDHNKTFEEYDEEWTAKMQELTDAAEDKAVGA